MKRLLAFFMAAMLLLALVGCAPDETDPAGTNGTNPTETAQTGTLPSYPAAENPVTFFSLSLGEDYENIRSITVSANYDGSVHVEYVGDVKKVGELDPDAWNGITATFAESGLAELNGQDAYSDGEANGSMYVEFADGTCVTAGFSGEIPEDYRRGYAAMDEFFALLTAGLPVYVPQPVVMGDVDPLLLEEVNAILTGSGIQNVDAFTISQVAKDEYFAHTLGLSSGEGITSAVSLAPMMMTTAYSLVIVALENPGDRQDVCADFMQNLDWTKWVCVAPTDAMVAAKGNMVLCLMAAEELYDWTAAGVEAAGWTVIKAAENR